VKKREKWVKQKQKMVKEKILYLDSPLPEGEGLGVRVMRIKMPKFITPIYSVNERLSINI